MWNSCCTAHKPQESIGILLCGYDAESNRQAIDMAEQSSVLVPGGRLPST